MASDPDLQRRVSRLENDTESSYQLIDDFRSESRMRLDRIDGLLANADTRFDRIEATLEVVLQRLPDLP